jgi:imidazolonepropionase-like amidohydrolase
MIRISTTVLPEGKQTDLFVADGRFRTAPTEDAVTIHSGGYAVPGLVEAHAHLALASPAGSTASEHDRIHASARAQIEAGVLLVREPGSPSRAARDLDPEQGLPRVHTAGRFVAGVGRYFPGLAREVTPDELPDAVAEEYAWSGRWAKVIGDFFDSNGELTPVFPLEALEEAAARVHAAGGRITMHAMIAASVEQAIEAGFDGVEHGTAITAELVKAMADARMTWVPTLSIAPVVRQMLSDDPHLAAEPVLSGLDLHPDMVRLAAELGVRVLAGTDAGMVPHGVIASEIRLLAAAGLSPRDALAAGSWEARRYLGLPLIEEGAPADLVVFPDDPTEDLSVLAHPSLIMIGGTVIEPH